MPERLIVLGAVVALCALVGLAYSTYQRRAPKLDRLEIDDLGLELMTGCCAFVVFTSESCRPCKAALRIVGAAAERTGGMTEVRAVDAGERNDLVLRYDVRTVPTTFLITASGHVLERWRNVPEPGDVERALAAV